jgi:citrate synthase
MPRKVTCEEQPWCCDPTTKKPIINKGVENVCIDESEICFIDGYHSRLFYRGYSIEDLAEKSTAEEVVYLLWYGKLPTRKELEDFKGWLREERDVPDAVIDLLKKIPKDVDPMEALRTAVSFLGNLDPGRHDMSWDGMFRKAIRLYAKVPTIIAAMYRIRNGLEVVPPDPRLSHAENFLYMFHGEKPPELWAKAMDVSLILYAEHENNASAFTAVVIASTLADYYSAITGAIGALRGPLHGYANVEAIKQFLEIGDPDNVEKWFNEYILTKKKRLMGFGHRVYKSYDPRAKIYREYAKKFAETYGGDVKKLYDIAYKLEQVALKSPLAEKGIYTNVDYWSGIIYYGMKIPIEYYCTLFAMSRIAGWTAHILEYTSRNRIIRPRYYYSGEIEKEYIPIDQRG